MLTAHPLDGIVFIPNCDKIVPGMMLAAARLNLPSIFISGGPIDVYKRQMRTCWWSINPREWWSIRQRAMKQELWSTPFCIIAGIPFQE